VHVHLGLAVVVGLLLFGAQGLIPGFALGRLALLFRSVCDATRAWTCVGNVACPWVWLFTPGTTYRADGQPEALAQVDAVLLNAIDPEFVVVAPVLLDHSFDGRPDRILDELR
jgi:hypothetical protein